MNVNKYLRRQVRAFISHSFKSTKYQRNRPTACNSAGNIKAGLKF